MNATRDNKALTATITKMNDAGDTRAKIEGYLLYEHDFSVNEAKELVQSVLGKSGRDGQSLQAIVEYVRTHYGKVTKQELIEGMVEVSGGAFSSMNHMYNYIRMAQEYARQEIEAAELADVPTPNEDDISEGQD